MPTLVNCADCPFTSTNGPGYFDCADGSTGYWGGITQADCSLCSAWAQGFCGDEVFANQGSSGQPMSALQGMGSGTNSIGSSVSPIGAQKRRRR